MINNIPIETEKCNNRTDYEIPIAADFESTLQLANLLEDLSIIMIAEYSRTITFTSVQVTNIIRSLEYFYPSLNDEIISKLKTMIAEIISILDYFNKRLRFLFDSKRSKAEKEHEVLDANDMNTFQVHKAVLMERMGVKKLGNNLKFSFMKSNILDLSKATRSRIGDVALKFQEDNFINHKVKEIYYG